MKTIQKQYSGAFGATEVDLTPGVKRALEFDIRNCPHCGVHHASLDGELRGDGRVIVRCPATGGRQLEIIIKMFLHIP
jgi:hypothetical protein